MDLVHEFTLRFALGETFQMGGGPYGARGVGVVGDGRVTGDRINGRLVGPAADWALIGADGYAQIDVRAQIRTDEGADLYLHYTGSLEMNDVVMRALLSDGETNFGDGYWCTHVRLEAGPGPYEWVNRTLFVGRGRAVTEGIEYEVHRLA